ncbi:MAG: hypothetical protein CMP24_01780 [Rickettsiales bacterium]|nr:hypothetical protein [Rickettsiales bacterium]|tara:strand:- start:199 stop:1290 length:1092 start_codon:yes stop_codon:yes gene_type:complete
MFEQGKLLNTSNKIINLSLGEPSANLPKELLKKISEKIVNCKMEYTESLGFLKLRKLLCKHYKKNYNLDLQVNNVAVTSGASAAILMALMVLFNEGEFIATTQPGYPCYDNIIKSLNLKSYKVKTKYEENFQLHYKDVERLPKKIKGLIISSPSNPTGTVISNENLKKIAEICKARKIIIISDEIYHGISYSKENNQSIFKYNKNSVVINSFSKYFLMTGWRLGWLIADKKIVEAISKLAMNLYLCPPSISQYTAMGVFQYYSYFDKIIEDYKINRNLVLKELNSLGFEKFTIPYGAFYSYVDVSKLTKDSYKFCQTMLRDIQVTTAPGIDFDNRYGHLYIRISFAGKKKDVFKAFERIRNWI